MLNYEWDEDLNNGSRPGRPHAVVVHDGHRRQQAPRQRTRATAPAPPPHAHALSSQQRRARVRRRHRAVVVGPRQQPRPRLGRGGYCRPAGDRQSASPTWAPSLARCSPGSCLGTPDGTAPVSVITSPTAGAILVTQRHSPVTISGTASDTGGSVSLVEVSTNNGSTWAAAIGNRRPGPSSGRLTVRPDDVQEPATDSNGNRETPSAGVTVTIAAPATRRDADPTVSADRSGTRTVRCPAASTSPPTPATTSAWSACSSCSNGSPLGLEDTSSPYSISWNTTGTSNDSSYAFGSRARCGRPSRHRRRRAGHRRQHPAGARCRPSSG